MHTSERCQANVSHCPAPRGHFGERSDTSVSDAQKRVPPARHTSFETRALTHDLTQATHAPMS
eukprot:3750318-Pyramimonas_sp.AAC.1